MIPHNQSRNHPRPLVGADHRPTPNRTPISVPNGRLCRPPHWPTPPLETYSPALSYLAAPSVSDSIWPDEDIQLAAALTLRSANPCSWNTGQHFALLLFLSLHNRRPPFPLSRGIYIPSAEDQIRTTKSGTSRLRGQSNRLGTYPPDPL